MDIEKKNPIVQINEDIDRYTKDRKGNDHGRNKIHFFCPNANKPINIVGSFSEAIQQEKGECSSFCSNSKMSFGINPEVSYDVIRELLCGCNSPFANYSNFSEYINANYENFFVDEGEFNSRSRYTKLYSIKDFQKAFFARCLVASSWSYGFIFSFNEYEENNELLEAMKVDKAVWVSEKKKKIKNNRTLLHKKTVNNDKQYCLYGRLSQKTIEEYKDKKIIIWSEDGNNKEVTIENLYSEDNDEYIRCESVSLYSGVIPRLCRVEYNRPNDSNKDIHKIEFILGRTTYMTMYAFNLVDKRQLFGNEKSKKLFFEHPLLVEKSSSMSEYSFVEINSFFDKKEVEVQKNYYEKMKTYGTFDDEISILNEYLAESWNIHNVNISSNIITSDDNCIFVRRSSEVSDGGRTFCSVNGGSEIRDNKVSFYSNSVREDIPTIEYGKEPFYFGGEMTREAIGELGISDASPFWKYYGFTSMAYYKENDQHALWLHFNILGEKYCSDTYEQIVYRRKAAAEKFENEKIFGYEISIIKNRKDFFIDLLRGFMKKTLEWKDSISTIVVLSFILLNKSQDSTLENWLSCIFLVIAGISAIFQFEKWIEKRKKIKKLKIQLYKKGYQTRMFERNFWKNTDIDAIFYILTQMRINTMENRD